MKPRPTIFLSGVSSEFASFRDAVEIEIQKKGCFVENQPSFATDYRTIEAMLRQKLSEADAVIHIVGFRYGDEPKRSAGKARRSYTQMEYDIAREMGKPVFRFLSTDPSVCDHYGTTEDADAAALQLEHRRAIQGGDDFFYTFKDKADLSRLVAEIPPVASAVFQVDISRIVEYAPAELIGREAELALLNDVWIKVREEKSPRPHVLTFVALGGEGKTSLVARWAVELAHDGWRGCDAVFAWSFYSQGTREQQAASSDLFLKEAITFFGNAADKEFARSNAGAYEKGQRLARIVGQRYSLLILDGLEPLQYSPTSPMRNELKDLGLAALLKGLAANSKGLCIVTTRYSVTNLKAFWQNTAPEVKLLRLSRDAGVHLLRTLSVRGPVKDLESLVEDVKGHALTLNLLGTYVRDAHAGDIRRRDLIKLGEADAEEQSGHAFRVMEAYERAFETEGTKGHSALAMLRLLGVFDRPATSDLVAALIKKPAIPELTESLIGLTEPQRNLVLKRLEDAKLLTVNRDASGELISLDAHPLLREYFGHRLSTNRPDAWRAAHRRLYQHLCASTPDKLQPTLEDLQPLYQAVAHGCQAGLQQEVFNTVYVQRIIFGNQYYSLKKLGSFGVDLGAVASFFATPWEQLSSNLSQAAQADLPNQAAFYLRALGRLREAVQPMKLGIAAHVDRAKWLNAAIAANNLSELNLTLGNIDDAITDAEQSVIYAKRSGDISQKIGRLATEANSHHQAGSVAQAKSIFRKAERMQKKHQPKYSLLFSIAGFEYCDLLLATLEREAWQRILHEVDSFLAVRSERRDESLKLTELRAISERARRTLDWSSKHFPDASLLDIALDHLTLGRAGLYETILSENQSLSDGENSKLKATIDEVVNTLRRANQQQYLPFGLLTRASFKFLSGACTGPDSAHEDLQEAWEIAERGPMRLHMADIHLYRARLFFREEKYPWESARADLEAAEKLIDECGYHRRDEELADAKRAILGN